MPKLLLAIFKGKRAKKVCDKSAAEQHWVLVEGPAPGDAQFLGRWLLTAAKADKLLQEHLERDLEFKLSVARIELVYAFQFSPTATKSIELLMKDSTSFSLSVFDLWGDVFVVMAEIGFFSRTGDRYQMTLPKTVTHAKIKAALMRLVNTEDEDHTVHPERLVRCLDQREILDWQFRLDRLPWTHRVADRNILLDGS
jgi:hypothetical protein